MRLGGKAAVVTGGARGIGRAIVERFLAEGIRVALADLAAEKSEAMAVSLGNEAFAVPPDVTKRSSIDAMVDAVAARAGRIDILVNIWMSSTGRMP